MMKLLRWLLGTCDHRWKTIRHEPIWNTNLLLQQGKKLKVYDEYHLQCEKCGNMKRKRL